MLKIRLLDIKKKSPMRPSMGRYRFLKSENLGFIVGALLEAAWLHLDRTGSFALMFGLTLVWGAKPSCIGRLSQLVVALRWVCVQPLLFFETRGPRHRMSCDILTTCRTIYSTVFADIRIFQIRCWVCVCRPYYLRVPMFSSLHVFAAVFVWNMLNRYVSAAMCQGSIWICQHVFVRYGIRTPAFEGPVRPVGLGKQIFRIQMSEMNSRCDTIIILQRVFSNLW